MGGFRDVSWNPSVTVGHAAALAGSASGHRIRPQPHKHTGAAAAEKVGFGRRLDANGPDGDAAPPSNRLLPSPFPRAFGKRKLEPTNNGRPSAGSALRHSPRLIMQPAAGADPP